MHVFCDASETGHDCCNFVVAPDETSERRATLQYAKAKIFHQLHINLRNKYTTEATEQTK